MNNNTRSAHSYKAAYVFAQLIFAAAFAGIVFFGIGLVSFSGAPVRTLLETESSIDLRALYGTLALGLAGCSCVCGLAKYAENHIG